MLVDAYDLNKRCARTGTGTGTTDGAWVRMTSTRFECRVYGLTNAYFLRPYCISPTFIQCCHRGLSRVSARDRRDASTRMIGESLPRYGQRWKLLDFGGGIEPVWHTMRR